MLCSEPNRYYVTECSSHKLTKHCEKPRFSSKGNCWRYISRSRSRDTAQIVTLPQTMKELTIRTNQERQLHLYRRFANLTNVADVHKMGHRTDVAMEETLLTPSCSIQCPSKSAQLQSL